MSSGVHPKSRYRGFPCAIANLGKWTSFRNSCTRQRDTEHSPVIVAVHVHPRMKSDSPVAPDSADKLVVAVQELSLARDLRTIMQVVRRAARELTGADGATFVLKEGTSCFYAEEDAISPLWKGSRFPLSSCVSGWVMMNRAPVVIPDIYQDPRVPIEAYRPTFVKSLAMVPIRPKAPIAAIGNYWSRHHRATEEELKLLQALANSTSVAMENIELYADLERRVEQRTQELGAANAALADANRELEAFAYTASHDLRAPVRTIRGFAQFIADDVQNRLTPESIGHLKRIGNAAQRMDALVNDLLVLGRISATALERKPIDVSSLAKDVGQALAVQNPDRAVRFVVAPGARAFGDPGLIRIVLENLLANAWKFTARRQDALVEFGYAVSGTADRTEFFVRDNGAGFPAEHVDKLFAPFQRLHTGNEFPGVGVGLATVRRIISRHGGVARAQGAVDQGATFWFSLPTTEGPSHRAA